MPIFKKNEKGRAGKGLFLQRLTRNGYNGFLVKKYSKNFFLKNFHFGNFKYFHRHFGFSRHFFKGFFYVTSVTG
jgi:hypothetical protein